MSFNNAALIELAQHIKGSTRLAVFKGLKMFNGFEEFEKMGKDSFEAATKSMGEAGKGFQAIAIEISDYSKKVFEHGANALGQLIGAKSVEQTIEIQSEFGKKVYDAYVAELSKLGEMYVSVARNVYNPIKSSR